MEISNDQNKITTKTDVAIFVESNDTDLSIDCPRCCFRHECEDYIPCCRVSRTDKKNGYFEIITLKK